MNKKINLNFYCNMFQGNGYGGSGELMSVAMENSKLFDISYVHTQQLNASRLTKKGLEIARKPFIKSDIALTYALPHTFTLSLMLPYKFRVGFTMFETDKLPQGVNGYCGNTGNCADVINQMDLLLVPCEHNKELFKSSGVKMPIEVVDLGYDPVMYSDMTKEREERRKTDKTFTFLMTGTLTLRKNPGDVITAFMKLFANRPDVKLVLKTQSGTLGHWVFSEQAKKIWNIEIIDRYYSPEEMKKLYADADCFIFPSKGEGFGLPPLEGMATGLYSIFPNHTGMAQFANTDVNGVITKYYKEPALRYPMPFGDVGNWYAPDFDQLCELMAEAESNRDMSFEKGKLSAEYSKKYTYERTAELIYNAINKHYHD